MSSDVTVGGLAPPPFRAGGAWRPESDRRSPKDVLEALRPFAAQLTAASPAGPPAIVQLLDARGVAGPLHLTSALARVARARQRGTSLLSDPGAELVLYLSGSDQFPEAVRRVGLQSDTREVVWVASPPGEPGTPGRLLEHLGWVERPGIYPRAPTPATLARLGVDERVTASVPPERWELLAIEAGALVELPRGAPGRRKL